MCSALGRCRQSELTTKIISPYKCAPLAYNRARPAYNRAPQAYKLAPLKYNGALLWHINTLFRNDKKMDRILTGVGDGCDNCLVKKELWTDIPTIESGFSCDRTLESLKETYQELRKNKKGEIMKSTGDYETRQGICAEPVSLRETFSFTVTHKVKLCSYQGGSSSPLLFFLLLEFVEGSFD